LTVCGDTFAEPHATSETKANAKNEIFCMTQISVRLPERGGAPDQVAKNR
jgi:hypothetical protein